MLHTSNLFSKRKTPVKEATALGKREGRGAVRGRKGKSEGPCGKKG